MIRTIKDLKETIQNLPDDMLVMGYKHSNGKLYTIRYWLDTEDTLTEEEINDEHPNGVITTFVIEYND